MRNQRIAYRCEEWFAKLPNALRKSTIAILTTAIAAGGSGCGLERNRCGQSIDHHCDANAKGKSQATTLRSSLEVVAIEENPGLIRMLATPESVASTTTPVRHDAGMMRSAASTVMAKTRSGNATNSAADLKPANDSMRIPVAAPRQTPPSAAVPFPTENDPHNPKHLDQPSEISATSIAFSQPCFPTMIFKGSSIAIAAPDQESFSMSDQIQASKTDTSRFPVRSVMIVKCGGKVNDVVDWQPVRGGRAAFQQLTTGVYNVFYSKAQVPTEQAEYETHLKGMLQLNQTPDRKILIETIDVPMQTASLPWEEMPSGMAVASVGAKARPATMGGSSSANSNIRLASANLDAAIENKGFSKPAPFVMSPETEVLLQMAKEQGQTGWDYLERGSLFNARRSFVASLMVLGSKEFGKSMANTTTAAAAPQYPMSDILEGNEGILNELRRGTASTHAVAARLAEYVGNLPQMSHIVYGLGKTYDAISRDPAGLLPGSDSLAQVCYLAANMISPEHLAAVNDLAALLHSTGKTDVARTELLRAAQLGVNPRIAGNLGIVLASLDRPADAIDCLEWALQRDPSDMQSLRAWLRLRLSQTSSAIYADECNLIGQRLVRFISASDRKSEDGRWAICEFEYLRIVGREAAINSPSLMSKFWLKPMGEQVQQFSMTVPNPEPIPSEMTKAEADPMPKLPTSSTSGESTPKKVQVMSGEWMPVRKTGKAENRDQTVPSGNQDWEATTNSRSNATDGPVIMPATSSQNEGGQ